MAKKRSKLNKTFTKIGKKLKQNKYSIFVALGLISFPIIVGLIYKIPLDFIYIEIGDLLSFYSVALGLFASYWTYLRDRNQKSLARQESLRPKIQLSIQLDTDESKAKLNIQNRSNNDYMIMYISLDYMDYEKKNPLDANSKIEINLDYFDKNYPEAVCIYLRDDDGNEWNIEFEFQEESRSYCRIYIDPIS